MPPESASTAPSVSSVGRVVPDVVARRHHPVLFPARRPPTAVVYAALEVAQNRATAVTAASHGAARSRRRHRGPGAPCNCWPATASGSGSAAPVAGGQSVEKKPPTLSAAIQADRSPTIVAGDPITGVRWTQPHALRSIATELATLGIQVCPRTVRPASSSTSATGDARQSQARLGWLRSRPRRTVPAHRRPAPDGSPIAA